MRQILLCIVCIPLTVYAANVRITNLDNIRFLNYHHGDGAKSETLLVCVHSSVVNQVYQVTLTTNEGAFELKHYTNALPYTVKWDADGFGTAFPGFIVAYAKPYTMGMNASLSGSMSEHCVSGDPSTLLTFQIPESSFNSKVAGIYTGTINIDLSVI